MRWFLLLFIVACLHAKEIYTLDDLIQKALQNSPDIKISKLDVKVAKEKESQIFSSYLPKLDIGAGVLHAEQKNNSINSKDVKANMAGIKASAKELIYDFGKTSGTFNSVKNITKSFDSLLKEFVVNKKKDVCIGYYKILKNMALIDVANENIKLNEAQLNRSKRYFKAGIKTKVDVSDAKVRVLKAKISLKNFEYDLQKSYANLDKIIGFLNLETTYEVKRIRPNLKQNLYKNLKRYDLNLEEAIIYAYENRAKLKSCVYNKRAQEDLKRAVSSAYYPHIFANANYEKNDANKYGYILDKNQWDIGVYLKWNLYSGGIDKSRKQEQKLIVDKSIALIKQEKLKIKQDVTKAYISLNRALEEIKLSQSLLKLSKEKFKQVSKQYEHGLSDYIELQEARQGYIDAKTNLMIKYYDYFLYMAILDATIGR